MNNTDSVPTPNNGVIYAIIDTKAEQLLGGLQLHRADAPAIRFFGDVASDPQTMVHRHVEDFQLVRLGHLDLNNCISHDGHKSPMVVVITGSQWKAAQQPIGERHTNTVVKEYGT